MAARHREYRTGCSQGLQHQFEVGDRVETCSHCIGTVVCVACDEVGTFVVVRLDTLPGEFEYDPYDLEILQ